MPTSTKECRLDAQERRNRLMAIEAEFVRQSDAPVIIAGSTGSVAATMALMETLKGRPNSALVLHGLDRDLDAESWAVLGNHPEHPQHGLHQLLTKLGVRREDIRDLATGECENSSPRSVLERDAAASFDDSPMGELRQRYEEGRRRPCARPGPVRGRNDPGRGVGHCAYPARSPRNQRRRPPRSSPPMKT